MPFETISKTEAPSALAERAQVFRITRRLPVNTPRLESSTFDRFCMRLLLISQDFPPDVGGTQTYAHELARRLAKQCKDFVVIAPEQADSEAIDDELPCEVIRVPAKNNGFGFKVWMHVLKAIRQRRKNGKPGFDAALHVQWSSAPSVLFAARRFGGPHHIFVAAHGRELLLEPLKGKLVGHMLYNWARTYVMKRSTGFFPVSRYTRNLLVKKRNVPSERITVVHNGTDPDHFRPMDVQDLRDELGLKPHHKVLLTVSRLVERKGIDTVLRTLPEVARRAPDVQYLIIGDKKKEAQEHKRLEKIAREQGVTDRVRFLGAVPPDELPRYYNVCDVFVMPSRENPPYVEGFGIAFLEANACGKPVIGARSGGIPDAVLDGETGLLVEPDDEAALAEAIHRLLCDIPLARRLGRNGRQRIQEEATWRHAADQIYKAIATHL